MHNNLYKTYILHFPRGRGAMTSYPYYRKLFKDIFNIEVITLVVQQLDNLLMMYIFIQ
jgi:hypothetical protein